MNKADLVGFYGCLRDKMGMTTSQINEVVERNAFEELSPVMESQQLASGAAPRRYSG